MWYSLADLDALLRFLKDDFSALASKDDFVKCVNIYVKRLVARKKTLVSRHWYLHCLHSHIPRLLTQLQSLHPFDCSTQERANGQQTKAFLSVIQSHKSSLQLLTRASDQVYFHFLHPDEKPTKSHIYPKNRKRVGQRTGSWNRVTAMDDVFVSHELNSKQKNYQFSQ
jgi:hypothetical protein